MTKVAASMQRLLKAPFMTGAYDKFCYFYTDVGEREDLASHVNWLQTSIKPYITAKSVFRVSNKARLKPVSLATETG